MMKPTTSRQPSKALVFASFASLYLIWGSTYLAIAIAVKDIPPFLMAGTRFLVAGLMLYIWLRIRGQSTPDINSFGKISFSGFLMLFLGTGSLVWVEQYISSGLAAIIVATVPLWFVLLDKRQWKFHLSNKFIVIGLLIGFAGVLSLFAGDQATSFAKDKMQLISFFVLIGGSVAWAIGSLYAKYKPMKGSTSMKASIQMMAAGIISLIVGSASGELNQFHWSSISVETVTAVLYLVIFGSLIGYMSYVFLLSVKPPSLVGTYAYVNPVVAVFLGWLFANEKITSHQVIALIIILAGVIMVNLFKEKIVRPEAERTIQKNAA